jgi:hypothetical protein
MRSSKPITNYIVILIAVLVLISGSVSALSEDFSAFGSKKDVLACACDLTTDHITVHNRGDVTSTFMLFAGGEAAEWTNLAPQTFYLEPGEVKQVERFIKVPCSARGNYALNTTIKTLFDTEKVLEQTLKTDNCPNIQIVPKFSGTQEECPCTPVQYNFEVINIGRHMETYEISVEPFSEAISLSTDFLVLEPGEKQEVAVFINLECGRYGEQIFTFNAMAQGTGILGQTEFDLNIKKCYDYELVVGEGYAICQGVPNIIPYQVQNQANIANEYFVFVEGAEWAFPENETVSAWGGETVESNIVLFPPNEEESIYSIALNSISARGEEERTKEIFLETEKCYDYQLIETEGVFQAVECKAKDHVFVLKNIGSRETTYYVELEGLEWMTTNEGPIQLLSGEEVDVVVRGDAPCEAFGDYLENIYITIEEVNQTYLEEKIVSVYLKEEAYLPEIELSDMKIGFDGGETEVKITNVGYERATYDLSLIASDWITLGQSSVELAPGENATVILLAYPTEEVIEDLYSAELIARVRGEDLEYGIGFLVDFREEKEGIPLWLLVLTAGIGLLIVVVIIVLALVLGGKKKPKKGKVAEAKEEKKVKKEAITIDKREYRKKKKKEKKTSIWPIIVIIVLALIIAGGAFYACSTGLFKGEQNETVSEELEEAAAPEVIEEPADVVDDQTPAPEETPTGILTKEEIQEALITADRSGIAGEGNILEITNETEINLPLSIKNPTDRKAKFTINTEDNGWVSFERNILTVLPDSTSSMNVKITPDLEALEENDYIITINSTLEGKKIYYEETLDIRLTKQKPKIRNYWPWLLAGLIALAVIILIIKLSSGKGKGAAIKKESKKAKKEVKEKPKKTTTKVGKKESTGWVPVVIGIIVILIIAALGFWAYNTFQPVEEAEDVEEIGEEQPEVVEEQAEVAEEQPLEEPKLTEADVDESLITIDRSNIPGKGDVFKLEQEQYDLPVSINNPTDRKARFTVNTSNESWVAFDQYMILVGPKSVKVVNMTLMPDMDALKKNNYMISINTKLEGERIDYEEELSFVLKQDRGFEASYLAYALAGIILICLLVLIFELARKGESDKAKKSRKAKGAKEKDMAQINKELAALRKKTVLKVRKASS